MCFCIFNFKHEGLGSVNKLFSVSFLTMILASVMICVAQKDESTVDLKEASSDILYGCTNILNQWISRFQQRHRAGIDIKQTFCEDMQYTIDQCSIETENAFESYREKYRKAEASASTDEEKKAEQKRSAEFEKNALAYQERAVIALKKLEEYLGVPLTLNEFSKQ